MIEDGNYVGNLGGQRGILIALTFKAEYASAL
jgi:hypothetical protein